MTSLIRVGLLPHFSDTVERLGGDPAAVLQAAGLSEEAMSIADTFIPYDQYRRLLVEAVEATGCERFGLLMAKQLGPAALGVVGFAMQQSADLGTAFQLLSRFFHLHEQHGRVVIEPAGEQVRLGYWIDDLDQPGAPQAIDVAAAMSHNLLCTLAGRKVAISRFEFPYPQPADLSDYEFLGAEVLEFGTRQFGILIDRAILDMPTPGHDPRMAGLLEEYINQLDKRSGAQLSDKVRQVVADVLATGECTLEGVATMFRITPRTLQNWLQREGTSFQEIVEEVRKRLAVKYLRTSDIDLTNIAMLLGYSDSSAFSRSFRRWYGQSPSRWRKSQARSASNPPA